LDKELIERLVDYVQIDSAGLKVLTLDGIAKWRLSGEPKDYWTRTSGYCQECFDNGGCHQPQKWYGCEYFSYQKLILSRMKAISESALIYGMLRNSAGVVPVDSLLNFLTDNRNNKAGKQISSSKKVSMDLFWSYAAYILHNRPLLY
jgi:hypothetical protein